MAADLRKYRARRNFERTPEPAGDPGQSVSTRAQFVVQKHGARRLHYDFRLEHDGVLKSWAVPKGPSLDPRERRLAVQTEDHPIEYATFEGVIPQGEYGAGPVIVWDRGHWVPEMDPDKGFANGKLDFTLHGEKLRGRWTLVRLAPRGKEKDNWLLIKRRDREAHGDDAPELVDTLPESVLTGRSLDEVAASRDRVWHSSGDGEASPPQTPQVGRPDTVPGARPAPLPRNPTPQRATAAHDVPDGPGWFHEPKLAGLRLLARVAHGRVTLRDADDAGSRTAASALSSSALAAALAALPCDTALLDGVAVVFDRTGVSDAVLLEHALADAEARDEIVLVVFDLLHLDGWDLRGAALRARKELLRLLASHRVPGLRYGEHVEGHGASFYREACRLKLPGVVSKRADAPYRGDAKTWLVTPCRAAKDAGKRRRRSAKT